VDLLETVRVALRPHHAYGLIHLSSSARLRLDEVLACTAILQRRFNPPLSPQVSLEVRRGAERFPVAGAWPLAALATQLFGSAHDDASHRAWVGGIARTPDDVTPDDEAAWRRALALGNLALPWSRQAVARDPEAAHRRTLYVAAQEAVIHGRGGAFTTRLKEVRGLVYNVRSYWLETVLFGIIRHDYVEAFAVELGELGGDPLSDAVDDLYLQWLRFRNTLAWTHLSTTRDVPQELLGRVEAALGTPRLLREMEESFNTYVAQRDRISAEQQSRSLNALQVYGATFAAVSTIAAGLQTAGEGLIDRASERATVALLLALLGFAVFLATRRFANRRPGEQRRRCEQPSAY
jgi:hypothetical protein